MSSESRRGQSSTMYRLAAKSTLEFLDAHDLESKREELRDVFIQSILRLLEMYRYNALDRRTPAGILFSSEFRAPLTVGQRSSAESVKDALDSARKKAFGASVPATKAVDVISGYLKDARRKDAPAPKAAVDKKVRAFLTALAESKAAA